MSDGQVTPVDQLSGLPLPILSAEDSQTRYSPDLHHPFHPKNDPLLQGIGGQALRHCRVQRVRYETHHYDYHQRYDGPRLPTTDGERFRLVVMAAAGYIPKQALVLHPTEEPKIVEFSDEAREKYRAKKKIVVETPGSIQQFLREYVLAQDFSGLNSVTIDEFCSTTDEDRRSLLGDTILGVAARHATDPFKAEYREAHRERLIPQQTQRVSRFVLSSLCFQKDRFRLYNQLMSRLVV